MIDPWYKYGSTPYNQTIGGNDGGKKIRLKSNVYGNYFGLRHYSGTTWTINRSKGWYLRWITQLRIQLLKENEDNYLASNISEYGSPSFNPYYQYTGFNMGWIIEFIGKPVNGMQIYLKAYTGLYIHSNRSGTYSTGSRNSYYNWILGVGWKSYI